MLKERYCLQCVRYLFTLRSERYTRLALPTYQKLQVALLGKSFLIYQSERFHRISTTLKFLSRTNIKAVITFFKMQNFIPLLERSLIWLKIVFECQDKSPSPCLSCLNVSKSSAWYLCCYPSWKMTELDLINDPAKTMKNILNIT